MVVYALLALRRLHPLSCSSALYHQRRTFTLAKLNLTWPLNSLRSLTNPASFIKGRSLGRHPAAYGNNLALLAANSADCAGVVSRPSAGKRRSSSRKIRCVSQYTSLPMASSGMRRYVIPSEDRSGRGRMGGWSCRVV